MPFLKAFCMKSFASFGTLSTRTFATTNVSVNAKSFPLPNNSKLSIVDKSVINSLNVAP